MKRRGLICAACLLAVYGLVYAATYLAGIVDFAALAANKPPIFATQTWISDEGSIGYRGFGYKLVAERNYNPVKAGGPMVQQYGAEVNFRWKIIFPTIGKFRRDLEFRIPTSPPQLEMGKWDDPLPSEQKNGQPIVGPDACLGHVSCGAGAAPSLKRFTSTFGRNLPQ